MRFLVTDRSRRRRASARMARIASFVLVASLTALVAAPSELPPTGRGASWGPVVQWWSSLFSPSAQAATPQQQGGSAVGAPTTVGADATDSTLASGRATPQVAGALPAFEHVDPAVHANGASQLRGGDGFTPGESTRVDGSQTDTQEVFHNQDGSYTRNVHAGRVNFKDSRGTWKSIDNSLKEQPDGRLAPVAAPLDVQLAPSADDPALVALSPSSGTRVSFALEGAAGAPATVKGDTATYPNALTATDVTETTFASGVKESIVLRSSSAARSWRFPLTLSGLTPRLVDSGAVELVDAAGAVAAVIPHGIMSDASVNPVSGDHATSSRPMTPGSTILRGCFRSLSTPR
jgi:hypothetical protein